MGRTGVPGAPSRVAGRAGTACRTADGEARQDAARAFPGGAAAESACGPAAREAAAVRRACSASSDAAAADTRDAPGTPDARLALPGVRWLVSSQASVAWPPGAAPCAAATRLDA